MLAGLFIAVAAETFDLLEEQAAIAVPGRASAVLAGLHDAGNALMQAMEVVARAEEDHETAPSEAGRMSSAGGVRLKVKGAREGALSGIPGWQRKTGSGYAATYSVATVAAQRKRMLGASFYEGKPALSAGKRSASESETTNGLGWVETLAIQPMQNVLKAVLPLPATTDGFEVGHQDGRLADGTAIKGGRVTHRGSASGPAGAALGVQAGTEGVPLTERTLFLLGPSNPVRWLFVRAARSSAIGILVHLCVLLNSALLVLIPAAEDMPGQSAFTIASGTRKVIDLATTCVFSAELLIAVAAQVLPYVRACIDTLYLPPVAVPFQITS